VSEEITRIIARPPEATLEETEPLPLEPLVGPPWAWVYALWRPIHLFAGMLAVTLLAAVAHWFGPWWALAVGFGGPLLGAALSEYQKDD
jgi:hypothetical protein